jgi:hypothetical protein
LFGEVFGRHNKKRHDPGEWAVVWLTRGEA